MRILIFSLLTLTLTISITSCAPPSAPPATKTRALQTRANASATKSAPTPTPKTAEDRRAALAGLAAGIEGVDRASVVITGDTAIIGITLVGDLADYSDKALMKLKARVEEEARAFDPALEHVAVTASGELVERINKMAAPAGAEDSPPEISPEAGRVIEELTPPA